MSDRASTHAVGTITRRLTSITKAHHAAGHKESPASTHHFVVGETLKGIRRVRGTNQKGKDPLLAEDIRKIVGSSPDGALGLRDRALVLVGFAGAFRRSELAQILVSDLSFSKDGMIIDLHSPGSSRSARSRSGSLTCFATIRTRQFVALLLRVLFAIFLMSRERSSRLLETVVSSVAAAKTKGIKVGVRTRASSKSRLKSSLSPSRK
jgi:integrase